ncbi:MAG: hypothetical protein PHF31_10450 [Methylobacter sp.]|nr:hypothetical protein [Methylobacter sp.]
MDGRFQITKLDAARRQLHVAIMLLFDDGDPIAVHTLVGAASVIISDLVDQYHPDKSWDKMAQMANNITSSQYFQVMRKPQNFLKHAREDASKVFDFDPNETEAVAFWAVMNLGNFGPLSMEESVLQLWYLACHAPNLYVAIEPYKIAVQMFGDLRNIPRAGRLAVGKRVLKEQLADIG